MTTGARVTVYVSLSRGNMYKHVYEKQNYRAYQKRKRKRGVGRA
jgi:hypothetical protein